MPRVGLRVKPGASRTRVGGTYRRPDGPALVVAVNAPAVEGRATEAALKAVADAFGLRRREVTLISGSTSRDKVVELPDVLPDGTLTAARLRELLMPRAGGR